MDIYGFKKIIARDMPGWTVDETPEGIGEFLIRIKKVRGDEDPKIAVIVDGKVISTQPLNK